MSIMLLREGMHLQVLGKDLQESPEVKSWLFIPTIIYHFADSVTRVIHGTAIIWAQFMRKGLCNGIPTL
jgi:hypothetical protein